MRSDPSLVSRRIWLTYSLPARRRARCTFWSSSARYSQLDRQSHLHSAPRRPSGSPQRHGPIRSSAPRIQRTNLNENLTKIRYWAPASRLAFGQKPDSALPKAHSTDRERYPHSLSSPAIEPRRAYPWEVVLHFA